MDYFISCQLNTGVIKQMRESVLVKYRKSQKGFSLLELLLVLGIVAALIVASFIWYPKVRDARYVDIEAKHIGQIYASVRNVYAGQPDYSGLATTAVAIPAQFFPDDMLSKNITWGISSWGGYVVVDANDVSPSGLAASSFTISYSDVPDSVCIKLISAVESSFYNIYVSNQKGINGSGESAGKNYGTMVKQNGAGTDITLMTSTCNSGGQNNRIVFLAL
ncbi:type IV pilin [Klebsiella sp. G-Nf4]|nr:type IV pilin [Klebsiella sp. I-Nf8]PJX70576.1 type IV pilin [Klebsiella sp. G-Nf4]PJX73209.1 type IV pilin [Klebsiella sp. G2-16S-Nf13]PKJ77726.1 type IV pilin [Klebsiella sp. J-Nf11]